MSPLTAALAPPGAFAPPVFPPAPPVAPTATTCRLNTLGGTVKAVPPAVVKLVLRSAAPPAWAAPNPATRAHAAHPATHLDARRPLRRAGPGGWAPSAI